MKTLIKKATEKGFKSKARLMLDVQLDLSLIDYLWLCELQKWLRENHNLIVYPTPIIGTGNKTFFMHCLWGLGGSGMSETYEQALELALSEALTLIKKTPNN